MRELWEETGITSEQIVVDPDFEFVHEYVIRQKRNNKKKHPYNNTLRSKTYGSNNN